MAEEEEKGRESFRFSLPMPCMVAQKSTAMDANRCRRAKVYAVPIADLLVINEIWSQTCIPERYYIQSHCTAS